MDNHTETSTPPSLPGTRKPFIFQQPQLALNQSEQSQPPDDSELERLKTRRRAVEGHPQLHKKRTEQLDIVTLINRPGSPQTKRLLKLQQVHTVLDFSLIVFHDNNDITLIGFLSARICLGRAVASVRQSCGCRIAVVPRSLAERRLA